MSGLLLVSTACHCRESPRVSMHGRIRCHGVMSAPRKYPEELRGWVAHRAEGVVPAPGRDSQTSSRIPASCPSSTFSHTPWRTCSLSRPWSASTTHFPCPPRSTDFAGSPTRGTEPPSRASLMSLIGLWIGRSGASHNGGEPPGVSRATPLASSQPQPNHLLRASTRTPTARIRRAIELSTSLTFRAVPLPRWILAALRI